MTQLSRLSLQTLALAAPGVRRPAYDPAALKVGVVHLGVGAFHRAHQAVFTEDAVEAAGGDWGITGRCGGRSPRGPSRKRRWRRWPPRPPTSSA
jgi:hypothetical protein